MTTGRHLLLYFNTARYLQAAQIAGRLRFRPPRARIRAGPAPAIRRCRSDLVPVVPKVISMTGPGQFRFLNEARTIPDHGPWECPGASRLWVYNLHYFDDLNADRADERVEWHRALIDRWVDENPPGQGVAWQPYPVSRRIVNWIKWALRGNGLEPEWQVSLATQARHLSRNLEYHLLANHLLANAKALVFAGLYFAGHRAGRWLARGLDVLAEQVPEQVLPDGGHFERSPMYQAIALEDLLDLVNLVQSYLPETPPGSSPDQPGGAGAPAGGVAQSAVTGRGDAGAPAKRAGDRPGEIVAQRLRAAREHWLHAAARMLAWLRVMCHPDGDIAFFNDAAFGIAARPEVLERYYREIAAGAPLLEGSSDASTRPVAAGAPPSRGDETLRSLQHLEDSGYLRYASGPVVALLDVAPVGPDYQPGHAHADTLSFELSLFGQRLFVNSGTSTYEEGDERHRQRGTAAHNTVEINGENSSEVWRSFRVARRARPVGLEISEAGDGIRIRCAHDGYRRLRGRPVHRRTWRFTGHALHIEDRIEGRFRCAVAFFRLHPEVAAELHDSGSLVRLKFASGNSAFFECEGGDMSIGDSTWHPEFGLGAACRVIRCRFAGRELRCVLDWS